MEGLAFTEGFNRETRVFQLSKELGIQLGDSTDSACPPLGTGGPKLHHLHQGNCWGTRTITAQPGLRGMAFRGHHCLPTACPTCEVVCLDPPIDWPLFCGDPQNPIPLQIHPVLPLLCPVESAVCTQLLRWDSRAC